MKRFLVLLCLCVSSLAACDFFPESRFDLSPDSRLPRWFKVPAGMSRRDLTVTMSYYVQPTGRTATFDLYDSHKNRVAQFRGTLRGVEPIHLKAEADSPPGYPTYEVITVNGIIDVAEHRRMEAIFYLTDDPAVWKDLGVPN
jgi:hypothetical protein